jgi:hypothetical protein
MTGSDESAGVLITPGYAPAALNLPFYRRRYFRWTLWLALAFALACGVSHYLPDFRVNWKRSQAQKRCLAYTAPPDQVVFSKLPEDVATLPKISPEYFTFPHHPWVGFSPACLKDITSSNWPVLYLGKRTNSSGEQRLICISVSPYGYIRTDGTVLGYWPFHTDTWTVGSIFSSPRMVTTLRRDIAISEDASVESPRFYAGQPDPFDSSRFTIKYEIAGKAGHFVGTLDSHGEVLLKIQDGPLKGAATNPFW